MNPVELLLSKLPDAKPSGGGQGWHARCPAHDDRRPSLSIAEGDEGRALVHCHAGCAPQAVVEAVGLSLADLMPTNSGKDRPSISPSAAPRKANSTFATAQDAIAALEGKHGPRSALWQYVDAEGQPVGFVVRWDKPSGKDIRPVSRTKDGRWTIGGMAEPRPLYRLPDLLELPEESRVYVCEGEKAADAARAVGLNATTSAHGNKSASQTGWSALAMCEVVLLPDADDAGERYADDVAGLLAKLTLRPVIKAVRLPGLPFGEGGDMADFVAQRRAEGATDAMLKAEIEALADAAEVMDVPDGWPDFQPLFEPIDAPFPVDALPGTLRQWVTAETEATQTPAALPGLLALATVAAAVARRVRVEPWEGWREPTNLFVAVLLEPGNRKSAVFQDATEPLRELESCLVQEQRPHVERALAERRILESRLRKLEKWASERDDSDARAEALNLVAKLASEPKPCLPRLIADNVTPEKLEMLLAEQAGRMASMSAEGGVFDIMAGQYSDGAAHFDVYLKAHAGDELRTDRVGREGIHIKAPALTCAYAIQPAVIAGLANKPVFRGRGLLARFLYALPRSRVGRRKVRPAPMPEHVRREYFQIIQRISALQGERVLQLDSEAEAAFEAWMAEAEAMLDLGGDMEHLRDWGCKLAGLTLRLAGIMHMVAEPEHNTIGLKTMAGAIRLAWWSIPHAEAALNLMRASGAAHEGASHLWAWVRRRGLTAFTARDAWQATRRRFDQREHLDDALAVLVERGYIRRCEHGQSGPGRRSQPFEVRPVLLNDSAHDRTQNPQKVLKASDRSNSVDFVYASGDTESRPGNRHEDDQR